MSPDNREIAATAAWHLHDIDPQSGNASLLELTEDAYRAASFLDQRAEPLATGSTQRPLADLEGILADASCVSPHLIFHLGHCGSTLLSRALQASPAVLPLREPQTLRRLAANPDGAAAVPWLDTVLRAHGRTFRPGQRPVIKATSTCNALIGPALDARPRSRAVLMYVDLETYLAGLLGKQQPALDLAGHLPARLADWSRIPDALPLHADRLDEAERAALAWLTGMRHFVAATASHSGRTRLLDFERFLGNAESELREVAEWLGFGADVPALLAAWPEVSTGYSKKPDEPYSAFNRRRALQRGRTMRASEIAHGLRWAADRVTETPALAECARYFGSAPNESV